MATQQTGFSRKRFIVWMAALIIGSVIGTLEISWLNASCDFVAAIYTRLFKFISMPTIALAILTTLATLGDHKNSGRIFRHTIVYTVLTTLAASAVGALLYILVAPGNLPAALQESGTAAVQNQQSGIAVKSYVDHILSVVPDNLLTPLATNNVMGVLLVAAAAGLALAFMEKNDNVKTLIRGILGLQELLFTLIKALVWTLPLGIVAFAAQLSAQMSAGIIVGSLGKYVLVVLCGNVLQFFVILPLFMLIRKVNPLKVFKGMLPAVVMALLTKSSAATLPVTISSAENNLKAKPEVARFILPVCCTINMNGCAAFILVTSLFTMQNGGTPITLSTVLIWILISVLAAVGNAGVPMGCFFLTLSLMSGQGAPLWILGAILPIYTIIDMIETAVNVWSDSCICAIVDRELTESK
ncbi:MAG: dicarboxylate/amino acid:cation symporter [Lentisphaerae bacterium]|nr:dicarboxylate/amino acid:cation symporter [Lentisphaerota bacterium]